MEKDHLIYHHTLRAKLNWINLIKRKPQILQLRNKKINEKNQVMRSQNILMGKRLNKNNFLK